MAAKRKTLPADGSDAAPEGGAVEQSECSTRSLTE